MGQLWLKIFRSGIRGNHDRESDSPTYYISSLSPTSSLIPQGIRRHWSIENRLHWVKDAVTKEDTSPQLQGKARTLKGFWSTLLTLGLPPRTNISIIKSWVINLLRVHGFDSMTEAFSYMSHNLPLLLSFCH